jgi:hypothetical protein
VLELGDVVDRGLDPEDNAELVVHLDPPMRCLILVPRMRVSKLFPMSPW